MLKGDFERLSAVLAGERPPAAGEGEDPSDAWPGAWISLRLALRGLEGTRFAWAVLERGTNEVAFTSADVGAGAEGPPPSASGTPVQADVWVPFPDRLGRFVVAVYLLPRAGQRLDEYVSPPFRVASLPGDADRSYVPAPGGAPAPAPTPAPSPAPAPDEDDGAAGGDPGLPAPEPSAPEPSPLPDPPAAAPAIEVPGPVFSSPG
jgi:hypothetical protein